MQAGKPEVDETTTSKADSEGVPSRRKPLFSCDLGPGLVTGCADDDPWGVSTYALAGTGVRSATLWAALLSFPMMIGVQLLCSRLGDGQGLRACFGNSPQISAIGHLGRLPDCCSPRKSSNTAADPGGKGVSDSMVTGPEQSSGRSFLPASSARGTGFRCWLALAPMQSRKLSLGGARWRRNRRSHPFLRCSWPHYAGRSRDRLRGTDAVKMIFWSAVVSGGLAAPLILLVVLLPSKCGSWASTLIRRSCERSAGCFCSDDGCNDSAMLVS
jgi:hypothetical protein